jgi:hypothetical protein
MSRIAFISFFMGLMAMMAQGCNDTDFAATTFSQGNNDLPPGDDTPTVCDPFGGGAGTGATNGLEAQLTYLPRDAAAIARGLTTASFEQNEPEVEVSPVKLILSQLNVATRPFTDGFTIQDTGGDKLQNLSGEDLIEYFSVRAQANLKLSDLDSEGNYELALLSDDGSILDLDPTGDGKSFERWVNNDGTHANKLGCATKTLAMKRGAEYPIKMNYYQGPRVRIALMLLWRKKTASTVVEPECGVARNDTYFFTAYGSVSSIPTANYSAMLSRGWKPVAPANFILPNNQTNPCAKK